MALLLKNNAVFLHIPKTGGNWVRDVLQQQNLIKREVGHKHCDIDRVLYDPYINANIIKQASWSLRGHKTEYPQPYTFCFVRHPLSWYTSWFHYMSQRNWNHWPHRKGPHDWHPCAPLNQLANTNFTTFIHNVITQHPGYLTQLFSWYTKRGINYIGKQESLADDLIRVLIDMNLDFNEKQIREYAPVNVSQKSPSSWDYEQKEEILLLEQSIIRQYKYTSNVMV